MTKFTPLLTAFLLAGTWISSCLGGEARPNSDWPQWRGQNRDGVAAASPKLLDAWPKEGPPLVWKSGWIPGGLEGGCGSPVVADGKVFLYVNWKHPREGGAKYRLITQELLLDAGWLPDLPEPLAKKIEAAWSSANRPNSSGWRWWFAESAKDPKDKELDDFLAKKPELDKYIKDFVATLDPKDAQKYGAYIKRRLCMSTEKGKWGVAPGLTWDELAKLSTFRDKGFSSYREWLWELRKEHVAIPGAMPLRGNLFVPYAWIGAFTMTDTVVCLDAATGMELWKKEFPEDEAIYRGDYSYWDWHLGDFANLGASGTMAVANGKCYAAGAMGLYCLSAKDGSVVWKVDGKPEHSSPLVAGGIVYHCGAAYNAENGTQLWKHPRWKEARGLDEFGRYSPAELWVSGDKNYILTSDTGRGFGFINSTTCCLELETGKLAWSLKGGPYGPISGDLFVQAGKVYKMTPTSAEPVASLADPRNSGPSVIHQGHLYAMMDGGDGGRISLSCSDLKTGEMKWKDKCPAGEGVISMPALADGKMILPLVFCHNFHGGAVGQDLIQMVKASPDEKYVQLGIFNPKNLCSMTSPAVAGGLLFLRLEDGVACYDLRAK
ncbi:MAG: PQQ-binding-like beta-propeller repeat protein [Planctomycetes bacterium]|nr:PQQ-binding-like beta-propeller repeat protein [Planctomycetota bacterium]